jgi:putative ABC transport system permease protein
MWGGKSLDLRIALRALKRSPAFTAFSILTLAIGIGASAAAFAVSRGPLFEGFHRVRDNPRLAYVTTNRNAVYYPDFEWWRTQSTAFEDMALVRGVFTTLSADGSGPATYFTTEVSANTFRLLGVQPMLGRDFVAGDAQRGATRVVILRHDLWRSRFAADPAVVGRTVRLNGLPTTIIGVMPEGFSFPEDQRLWTPLVPTDAALERQTFFARYGVGRLAAGSTIERARMELTALGRQLEAQHPDTNRNTVPVAQDFRGYFIGSNGTVAYTTLWGAAMVLLLIASGNVGNLLLQRTIARGGDVHLRLALGASRWRAGRHLMVESLVLCGAGGALGWWIATAGATTYALMNTSGPLSGVSMKATAPSVWLYVIAISIGAGLLAALPAIVSTTKFSGTMTLKDAAPRGAGQRGHLPGLVLAGGVALTLVALTGAGLMVRSLINVFAADIGITQANVLTMSLYIPPDHYVDSESQVSFYQRLRMRLEAVPGVESVALGGVPPTESAAQATYELAGAGVSDEASRPSTAHIVVSPGYFHTLGAPVVDGREFTELDGATSPPVAIVNDAFVARQPAASVIGKQLRLFREGKPQAWLTIVGVTANIVQNDRTRQTLGPVVYLPYRQRPQPNMFVFARTRVAPETLRDAFAAQVYALDPGLPVPALMPLTERFSRAYAFERNITVVLLAFALVALMLAVVGVYATVAHSVALRTREIGIRIAIGATSRDIRGWVMHHGIRPLLLGLIVGSGAAMLTGRFLPSLLVRVSSGDPLTLLVASIVLVGAGVLGCFVPAQRASRIDPSVALRHE